MWATAAACPAARAAAAAAGALTSRAAPPPTNRRRISSATSSSPRAKARVRAIASRGRRSCGAAASNNQSTRSAQSAAQAATVRRSRSLNVCGEPMARSSQRSPGGTDACTTRPPFHALAVACNEAPRGRCRRCCGTRGAASTGKGARNAGGVPARGSLPYAASAWRGGQPALGVAWPMIVPRRVVLYAEYRLTGRLTPCGN
jgi:hypothetical protein